MRKEDSRYFLQVLSTAIAIGLPLVQFTFYWLPPTIKALYISKDLFLFSSLVTVLISYMVIITVVREPFGTFRAPLFRKYTKLYNEEKRQWHPIQITFRTLSKFFIPTVFILSLVFVYMGIKYSKDSSGVVIKGVLQAAIYSLITILSVFVFSEYFGDRRFMVENDERRATRGIAAINLAKEANSFKEMPKINLVGVVELPSSFSTFGNDLITYVGIGEKFYAINTDTRAGFINSVVEVNKKVIERLSELEENKISPPQPTQTPTQS